MSVQGELNIAQTIQVSQLVLMDVSKVVSKDPKTIPQEEYLKVLEGIKMVATFLPQIFHLVKKAQESQTILITKELIK